jgi:hypothetical protein
MGQYGTAGTGREKTFGRALMNYVSSKLPYSGPYQVIDDIQEINPRFKDFYQTGSNKEELLVKHSVSTHKSESEKFPAASIGLDKNYHAFMYANVDYDKSKRLRDYRVMAQFAEVSDALDEICDECINKDDDGNVVKIQIRNKEFNLNIENQVRDEFRKFIKHYDMQLRGWEYFRQLLVDGELFFEHIIHREHKTAGILGVIMVPSDLVDPIYDNVQNLLVKGYLLRKPHLEKKDTKSGGSQIQNSGEKPQFVPFDKNQMTYCNSGIWNETKSLRMPFIEIARRAYRQLSLIEDSIVIYRLVRAPERLVFNVDVGNMPPPKAEAYLKKLMANYWSRKTYDSSQGASVQAFNPQSMLDSFWFAKRQGSTGTEVVSLPGGQNLGQLDDLKYFKQKLYRALKVPVARLDPEAQADAQGSTILREELKFARFIIRLQTQVSGGLRDAFVTHLKLRDIWDQYKLKETDFELEFNPPSNFHELRDQQIRELKWGNYSAAIGNPLISDTYAKKDMLGMTDNDLLTNRELLRKDAALKWELMQIEANGPNWREALEAQAEPAEPMAGGMEGGGGPMPTAAGGGELPPAFGAAPPGAGGEVPPVAPGGEVPPAGPAPVGGQTALP